MKNDIFWNSVQFIDSKSINGVNRVNLEEKLKREKIPFIKNGKKWYIYKEWKNLIELKSKLFLENGKVISFGNNKGGVGKTTTVINIGAVLSTFGFKVLLIDMDSQANLTHHFNAQIDDDSNTVLSLINGKNTFVRPIKLRDEHKYNGSLDLIANDLKLADKYCNFDKKSLVKSLAKLKKNYDFILLDTPPNYSDITPQSLFASDYGVIVLKSDIYSADGAINFMQLMEKNNTDLISAIITYCTKQTLSSKISTETIKDLFDGFEIFNQNKIRNSSIFGEIALLGENGAHSLIEDRTNHIVTEEYINTTLAILKTLATE